jgi:hypothetical protein
MKRYFLALLAACGGSDAPPPDAVPDAGEPKPVFLVENDVTGAFAIDDAGIRATYVVAGATLDSVLHLQLTEAPAPHEPCELTIAPHFVRFDTGAVADRQFKTVVVDVAASTVVEDLCHWDDAFVLAAVANQWGGPLEIGFAQAGFFPDRPKLDLFLDAALPFLGDLDTILIGGGASAFAMAPDGTVDIEAVVEPAPGTLLPALYVF